MTLWDGKILTEDEVAAREMCECEHTRAHHVEPDGSPAYEEFGCCALCEDCDEFTAKENADD